MLIRSVLKSYQEVKMSKILLLFGFVAILACALAVPDCPKDEDENSDATYFPHETECGKFYECHYGIPEVLECSSGLYWDQRLNVCNRDVDCGNLSTSTKNPTTATTTTEAPTEATTEASNV